MHPMRVDNRRDILLLLLYSPGSNEIVNDPIVGRTRLMKMLFLFKEEALKHFRRGTSITEDNYYDFFPWNFGPFSKQVYDDLTFFILRGMVEAKDASEDTLPESAAEWERWISYSKQDVEEQNYTDYSEQTFQLSESGMNFTVNLYNALSNEQRELLKSFKRRLNQAPLRAILKYVYENYPTQTDRSHIKEKILGNE